MMQQYDELIFDADSHSYTHRVTGLKFIGWSSLKKKFSKPFDPDGILAMRCAKKEGITVAAIKAKWKLKSDTSLAFGTKVHAGIESLYRGTTIELDNEQEDWMQKVRDHPDIKGMFPVGKTISEQLLYDVNAWVAGTTDLMHIADGRIHLGDFKTNEKIDFYNIYKNFLLAPFDKIPDISGVTYALQLSVYMVLACRMTGLKPGYITLIHLDKTKGDIKMYQPDVMLKEAEKIISLAKNFIL